MSIKLAKTAIESDDTKSEEALRYLNHASNMYDILKRQKRELEDEHHQLKARIAGLCGYHRH